MNTRRLFTQRLLGDIFFFGFMHSIASVVIFLTTGRTDVVFAALLLALPFFLLALVRTKIENIFLFSLLHIAVLVFFVAIPPLPLEWRAFIAAFIFAAINYSFAVRQNKGLKIEKGLVTFCCIFNTALVLFCGYMNANQIVSIPTFWTFIMLLAYLLYMQSSRLDASLELVSNKMRQPMHTITRFNNSIILGFVLLAALILLLAPFLPLGQFLAFLVSALLAVMRLAINFVLSFVREEVDIISAPQSSSGNGGGAIPVASTEPHPFWLFLEQLTFLLTSVVIVAVIVGFLLYAFYSIYRSFFANRSSDSDIREYIGPASFVEQLRTNWGDFIRKAPTFSDDNAGHVRKAYYKKVQRHIRRGANITVTDTTSEICEKLSTKENISSLTELYNLARYNLEIPEDISLLRKKNSKG